jgi:hypothetical protein
MSRLIVETNYLGRVEIRTTTNDIGQYLKPILAQHIVDDGRLQATIDLIVDTLDDLPPKSTPPKPKQRNK